MKKFSKVILLIMSVLIITTTLSFAEEGIIYSETDNDVIEKMEQNKSFFSTTAVFPVVNIPEDATESEKNEIIQKTIDEIEIYNITNKNDSRSIGVVQGTAIFRNGNSTECELYISWTGTETVSMFAFDNFKVQSTALVNHAIYSNISGSTIYCESAAKAGYAKVKNINIPTNISKVRAVIKYPKVHTLEEGWLYGTSLNMTVTIN